VSDADKVISLRSWLQSATSNELLSPERSTARWRCSVNELTLNQLKVFEVVARCRNFTRAAQELNLTQPSVSLNIKQLTNAVGMPLFEFIGKKIFLTTVGQELLNTSNQVFEGLSQLETNIDDLKGIQLGRLKIATNAAMSPKIAAFLNPFCQYFPDVHISVEVIDHSQMLQRLSTQLHDLYFTCEPLRGERVCSQTLLDSHLVVVAAKNLPFDLKIDMLNPKISIPLAHLDGQPFIMREDGSATRQAVKSLFDQHHISVRTRLEVGDDETIKQMVIHGLGISVLPSEMVIRELENGHLVILNIEGFPIRQRWHVVYPEGKQLSSLTRAFLQFLNQQSNDEMALAA
jgi:DNA-binding transcriptional LysR family regulator